VKSDNVMFGPVLSTQLCGWLVGWFVGHTLNCGQIAAGRIEMSIGSEAGMG